MYLKYSICVGGKKEGCGLWSTEINLVICSLRDSVLISVHEEMDESHGQAFQKKRERGKEKEDAEISKDTEADIIIPKDWEADESVK